LEKASKPEINKDVRAPTAMLSKIQIDKGTAGDRKPKNTSDNAGSTFCRAKIVSPTTITSKKTGRISKFNL
jgi:hypothetical protein